MALDLAHLKGWIGRTADADDIVTPRLLAEYRATFAPNLAETAQDETPPAFHWCLSPTIVPAAEVGPDGHPKRGGFLPPVPLPRRMWAGGEVEIRAPFRVGDTVTRRSAIADVSVKEGRSGTLCFVAVRHEYFTERGLAVSERHDIVYRDAEPSKLAPARHAEEARHAPSRSTQDGGACFETQPAAAPQHDAGAASDSQSASRGETRAKADLTWTVDGTSLLLFRYSAMTFNGHRIHYDLPYVTGEEGYAGLVVHGPIQATLLLNIATVLGGKTPKRFRYRGLSPLIAGASFTVSGARTQEGGLRCWTENRDGRTCMEAEVPA